MTFGTLTCKGCGQTFRARQSDQEYCGEKCRWKAARARERALIQALRGHLEVAPLAEALAAMPLERFRELVREVACKAAAEGRLASPIRRFQVRF